MPSRRFAKPSPNKPKQEPWKSSSSPQPWEITSITSPFAKQQCLSQRAYPPPSTKISPTRQHIQAQPLISNPSARPLQNAMSLSVPSSTKSSQQLSASKNSFSATLHRSTPKS